MAKRRLQKYTKKFRRMAVERLKNSEEWALRKENCQLKQALAEKTLELDFFRGALHKVAARRQQSGSSGEKASTTKSKTKK